MQTQISTGFRLSPSQRRLWSLHQNGSAFCSQIAISMRGPLAPSVLNEALQRILDRHEILRTTFNYLPGWSVPVQTVADCVTALWREVDLRDLCSDKVDAEVDKLFCEESQPPFDCERGPLFRACLARFSDDEHVLFLTVHSMCADSKTLANLFNELGRAYADCLRGEFGEDEAVQYVQFSEWQHELSEAHDDDEGSEYWRRQDFSALGKFELPLQHNPVDHPEFMPDRITSVIGAEQMKKIEAVANRQGADLGTFLLSCLQVLLWRLTEQESIVIATLCDGRVYEEMEGGFGLYARWPLVDCRLQRRSRFLEVLQQTSKSAQDAIDWQEYFFLTESLQQIEGNPADFILPVGFSFEKLPDELHSGDVDFSVLKQHSWTERFKLRVGCVRRQDDCTIDFHYDPAFYPAESARRFAGEFFALLESATENPERQIIELNILDETERHQLVSAFNETEAQFPADKTFMEFFEAQVGRTPEAIAVRFEQERLTYAELNGRANQFANCLQGLGVEPETLVASCVERSVEMIVGVLGILKAGGAYLPLDPSSPAERLLSVLKDAGAPVVLTQQKLTPKLEGYAGIMICVDAEDVRIESASQDSPASLAGPQNLAYVIYTSGSTGKPKGVMIEHRSLMNYLSWVNEVLVADSLSALPLVTELSFDASLKQLLAPLLRGDAIWAIPAQKIVDPAMLVEELCSKQRAGLNCVPSLWSACLEASLSAGASRLTEDFTTLLVGGEQISKALIERTFNALPHLRMWNLYGPTEATANAAFARILPDEPVTIGRPLSNTKVYVVDASLNPVPVGVPGELLIGGIGVARGYLSRAELTADRFVPDGVSGEKGARLYKTGDLVRRLADGRVEYLGRIDDQVKVRGYRIELGEVEGALSQLEGVREAAAAVVGEGEADKRLVGYVVEREGSRVDVREARRRLGELLPDYMVPSRVVKVESLPLTSSGKVDRRRLQQVEADEEGDGEQGSARTPVEETLEAIWGQVLGRQEVGRRESFFEAGGHSLMATQLMSRVREAMKVELTLRDLFEGPTIEEMGRRVEEELRGGREAGYERIRRAERGEEIPLSFAQQRLWFIDQLQPASSAYNIPVALSILGPLDLHALHRAINRVVSRHESLRTTFDSRAGSPVQVISPSLQIELPVIDLSQLAPSVREREAKAIATQEAGQGFDLRRGPLLRCKAIRLGDEEHGLVMSVHHIVTDGWSMGVLVSEVARGYEQEVGGGAEGWGEPEIQYADYAIWQRGWMSGEVLDRHLSYWRRQLGDARPMIDLPYDRPRPAVQTYNGALQFFTLSKPVTESLKRLSRQQSATLFMTLLAAFKALLYRYTGQLDISVGTPVANRNRIELERLIGFCVNTLVLRTRLSNDLSFLDLLDRVREVALQGYAHQDLPFEHLIDSLQLERDLSHTPLFQVMMVLQNAPAATIQVSDLTMRPMEVEIKTAKFDLLLNFAESGDELAGTLEYNTDLFDERTIERLLANFQTLINNIIADPNLRISEQPLLAGAELQQLVSEWNETSEFSGRHNLIHEAFQAQAKTRPHDIAVVCEDAALTYRELNCRANQLARYLRKLGVGPDVLVGICVERSAEMIVGLLGILKAGGAYVPMEPSHPRDALAYMIEDARISVLLTQEHLAAQLPDHAATTIYLDADWMLIEQESADDLQSEASPSNVAYVIYTSGSTGRPKGALVTHSNITRLLDATHAWFGFDHTDVWTLFHSYAFDFSVWELWGALAYGGRLVVVPHWVSRTPEAFYEMVMRERVTVLNQTPSAFQQFIRADEEKSEDGAGELSLRVVIFGGEALEFQSLKGWMRRHGEEMPRLVNMYGITETTVHVTYRPIKRSDISEPTGSRIGKQIPDLQMFVMDQQWQLAPIGVPGEIFVGGAGLARGYLNRFDLTAERFIPNPFSRDLGARLYRTGDLGRYLPGGEIEYLGRIDHQVKIRGFRIELEEIEAALNALASVRESLVIDQALESGEKRLVAYVVPTQEGALSVNRLRDSLKQSLPEYMIPSAFMQLEAFPLTVNGKIDRRALPVPGAARPELEAGFVPPRTTVEDVLAAIWGQVLGIDRVGVDDNYFALGGDSIRSIQVRALAQQRGLDFSLQDLFQSQTIRRLAQGISFTAEKEKIQGSPFSLISEIDRERLPAGVEDAYPLVRLQSGMLFHGEYHNKASLYHNVASVHLKAPFDADAMEIAARRLLDRHAVLRTSFDLSNYSEPLQLVHKEVDTPLFVDDIRHLSTEEQEQALAGWLAAEKARHFDWSCAPLLRFNVHRRSDDAFQFTLTEHHAILDGWSVASMLTELFQTYLSVAKNDDNDAAMKDEPALAYRDYVALERAALQSEESIGYWAETLEGAHFTPLPRLPDTTRSPDAPQMILEGVEVSSETTEGLFKLARTCGVPFKSVLLAAHMRVMRLLGGASDVNTGLVMNGRPETEDGERVLGLFLNAVLFRMNMPGGTWGDLVKQTFDKEMEILPYRRYPMADLQRKKGGQSLFDSAFTYTHFHVYERLQGFDEIEVLGGDTYAETNFPLQASFDLHSATGELRLALHANVDELGYEQIRRIGRYYERTLEAMASNPAGRYESANLLPEDEVRWFLFDLNNTEALYAKTQTFSQLFEEQVERTPESVAVICGDNSLSYFELNRRANQLANHLAALGVGPEVVVALCMDRSLELAVAVLGVLKAGAAYLPIDPSLPLDRIAFILDDSSARALLTQDSLIERLPAFWGETISLDGDWGQICNQGEQRPAHLAGPDNLAYIIYTSGSTGRPKGVMVTHRGLSNYLLWAAEAYAAASTSGSVVHSAIGFDLTVTSLYLPLISGKAVEMMGGEDSLEGLTRGVTGQREGLLVKATPTQAEMMAEQLATRGEVAKASVYVIGGEALRREVVEKLRAISPGAKVYNEYGPTEAVVGCSVKQAEQFDEGEEVAIGRPIGNARMYVMDEGQGPSPVGVGGEIYIGGAGLARGYLGRADLTADRFVPDCVSGESGARLYRSGDVGRYKESGEIEYMGRRDGQVKVRGYRIEVGEVESAIRGVDEGVREVAVEAIGEGTEKRLVAYVVMRGVEEIKVSEVRRRLEERLPSYMVPSRYVMLDRMPVTTNGKIDRRALPAPDESRPELEREFVAPRNQIERGLAGVWSEVLGINPIGIDDNFFDLGGDSLLAMQIIVRVRELFLVDINVMRLFELPTIAGFAEAIQASVAEPTLPAGSTTQPIRRRSMSLEEQLAELSQVSDDEVKALVDSSV